MEALATESGFELDEVFGTKPPENQTNELIKRKQIGFVKAKYINPEDSDQTWSGRGRKPKWAAKYIKDGGVLEDLLINPEIID
jgi:DNA-binding protein H-NS